MSEYVPEEHEGAEDQGVDDAGVSGQELGQELGQQVGEPVRTGVEEVDAVLDSVADLESRPVEEHVAVFENAHEQLRRALDSRPDA